MADSTIWQLPAAPALVGTERIPLDVFPFGVAGSTSYTTPTAIATFLANNNINGNLNIGFLPVASGPKTLIDSRVYQTLAELILRSNNNNSYLSITDTINRMLLTNGSGSSSLLYQDASRFVLTWNNLTIAGQVALEAVAVSIAHDNLIIINAPQVALNGISQNDRILGVNGSNVIVPTDVTITQLNNLAPITTVFTSSWTTQTLANVGTLYYFVNASNSTPKTINLPSNPSNSNLVTIKDKKGDAATNNITISGNGKLIDGVSSILINKNNQSYTLKYDGADWNII